MKALIIIKQKDSKCAVGCSGFGDSKTVYYKDPTRVLISILAFLSVITMRNSRNICKTKPDHSPSPFQLPNHQETCSYTKNLAL